MRWVQQWEGGHTDVAVVVVVDASPAGTGPVDIALRVGRIPDSDTGGYSPPLSMIEGGGT